MYDQDLMPHIDNMYHDTTSLRQVKQEAGINKVFDPFISEIEGEV